MDIHLHTCQADVMPFWLPHHLLDQLQHVRSCHSVLVTILVLT